MPRLVTGRHVAVMVLRLIDYVAFGTDVNVYEFVAAFRQSVHEPSDIRALLPVVYFEECQGYPPDAPAYVSGFLVQDVLSGKAGWSLEEIYEFRTWLEGNDLLTAWLTQNFDAISAAVQMSPARQTAPVAGRHDGGDSH